MKVEVAVTDSPPLTAPTVSVDVKQHWIERNWTIRSDSKAMTDGVDRVDLIAGGDGLVELDGDQTHSAAALQTHLLGSLGDVLRTEPFVQRGGWVELVAHWNMAVIYWI